MLPDVVFLARIKRSILAHFEEAFNVLRIRNDLCSDTAQRIRPYTGYVCHLHPSFGGFGTNMRTGDAVDLGWKLSATLLGWGGPGLLASYEPERRPVHEVPFREPAINDATVGNQHARPQIEEHGEECIRIRREVGTVVRQTNARGAHTPDLVLGAPILVPDGSQQPSEHIARCVPLAFPGCLAPYTCLADDSFLYDHFCLLLTQLATGLIEHGAVDPLVEEVARSGAPFDVLPPDEPKLSNSYGAQFAPIKPD